MLNSALDLMQQPQGGGGGGGWVFEGWWVGTMLNRGRGVRGPAGDVVAITCQHDIFAGHIHTYFTMSH